MKNPLTELIIAPSQGEPSDQELLQVTADFLAMGRADNVVAMFRQEPLYWGWIGQLLSDVRYAVRLSASVLCEQLAILCPDNLRFAIPSLAAQLDSPVNCVRKEAVSVLGIIGSKEAFALVRPHLNDRSAQTAKITHDILGLPFHG
jgi:hypothetical protein